MFNNNINFLMYINTIYIYNLLILVIFNQFNTNFSKIKFNDTLFKNNFFYYNSKNGLILTIIIVIFSGLPPFIFFYIKLLIIKNVFNKHILVSTILYFINTLSIYIYITFFKKTILLSKKKKINLKKNKYKNFYILFFYFLLLNIYGMFLYNFFFI